jgi:hypothetical protein
LCHSRCCFNSKTGPPTSHLALLVLALLLLLLQLNVVYFKVAGLGLLSGNLSIKASYAVESPQRVSIKFIESTLVSSWVRLMGRLDGCLRCRTSL